MYLIADPTILELRRLIAEYVEARCAHLNNPNDPNAITQMVTALENARDYYADNHFRSLSQRVFIPTFDAWLQPFGDRDLLNMIEVLEGRPVDNQETVSAQLESTLDKLFDLARKHYAEDLDEKILKNALYGKTKTERPLSQIIRARLGQDGIRHVRDLFVGVVELHEGETLKDYFERIFLASPCQCMQAVLNARLKDATVTKAGQREAMPPVKKTKELL